MERRKELDRTKDKMDNLVEKLYMGRERGLELQGAISAAQQAHVGRHLLKTGEKAVASSLITSACPRYGLLSEHDTFNMTTLCNNRCFTPFLQGNSVHQAMQAMMNTRGTGGRSGSILALPSIPGAELSTTSRASMSLGHGGAAMAAAHRASMTAMVRASAAGGTAAAAAAAAATARAGSKSGGGLLNSGVLSGMQSSFLPPTHTIIQEVPATLNTTGKQAAMSTAQGSSGAKSPAAKAESSASKLPKVPTVKKPVNQPTMQFGSGAKKSNGTFGAPPPLPPVKKSARNDPYAHVHSKVGIR